MIENNTGMYVPPGVFANGYETHNPTAGSGCGNALNRHPMIEESPTASVDNWTDRTWNCSDMETPRVIVKDDKPWRSTAYTISKG